MGSAAWVYSRDPGVRTWLIFAFGYAIALAHAFFKSRVRNGDGLAHNYYSVIAAIAVLGIAEFQYYAGRAVTPALTFLAFPLIMLFVLLIDRLVHSLNSKARTVHTWGSAALAAAALIGCGGVLADRYFREPYVLRSNANLLRNCLSLSDAAGPCVSAFHSVARKLQQPAPFVLANGTPTDVEPARWQIVPTKETTEQTISAYLLARKWLANEQRLFIFIPDPHAVLFALGKRNALGLSHPMVDAESPSLRIMAERAADNAKAGTPILVGNLEQLAPPMRALHARISERWSLKKIDSRGGIDVFLLQPRI
jgi:hypothetical protein